MGKTFNIETKRLADKRFYEAHKEERRNSAKDYYHKNVRWIRLRQYGITPEEWEIAFDAQGRKCSCCGASEPGSKTGWHTDHDHTTKQFRGILCHHCNTALGLVKDSVTVLASMIQYLERFVEQRAARSQTT